MSTNSLICSINSVLSKLLNQRIRKINRVANMLTLCFGDSVICVNMKGNPVIKSKYSLHIQCNWEITHGDRTLLSDEDFYVPMHKIHPRLVEDDDIGDSKFDELSLKFNADIENNPITVISFQANVIGGFHLALNNGVIIKVYPYDPSDGESWRFLMPGTDEEHFVIFDE